jgi:hypothetical protein
MRSPIPNSFNGRWQYSSVVIFWLTDQIEFVGYNIENNDFEYNKKHLLLITVLLSSVYFQMRFDFQKFNLLARVDWQNTPTDFLFLTK